MAVKFECLHKMEFRWYICSKPCQASWPLLKYFLDVGNKRLATVSRVLGSSNSPAVEGCCWLLVTPGCLFLVGFPGLQLIPPVTSVPGVSVPWWLKNTFCSGMYLVEQMNHVIVLTPHSRYQRDKDVYAVGSYVHIDS